jgi:hypothetical protein
MTRRASVLLKKLGEVHGHARRGRWWVHRGAQRRAHNLRPALAPAQPAHRIQSRLQHPPAALRGTEWRLAGLQAQRVGSKGQDASQQRQVRHALHGPQQARRASRQALACSVAAGRGAGEGEGGGELGALELRAAKQRLHAAKQVRLRWAPVSVCAACCIGGQQPPTCGLLGVQAPADNTQHHQVADALCRAGACVCARLDCNATAAPHAWSANCAHTDQCPPVRPVGAAPAAPSAPPGPGGSPAPVVFRVYSLHSCGAHPQSRAASQPAKASWRVLPAWQS